MKLKPSVTLLVPVLNERGGMEIILPRISKDWVERILIVDGGSNDGSLEYARENGYEVFTQTLKGPRGAFLECFQKIRSALERRTGSDPLGLDSVSSPGRN